MPKVICLEPLGIEGGDTYNSGEEYEVSAAILKEYGWAFSKPATKSKKDASEADENKEVADADDLSHICERWKLARLSRRDFLFVKLDSRYGDPETDTAISV